MQCVHGQHAINQGLPDGCLMPLTACKFAVETIYWQSGGCNSESPIKANYFDIAALLPQQRKGKVMARSSLDKLQIQDATALWHKRRNSRVFMNKTVVEVSEILFKE